MTKAKVLVRDVNSNPDDSDYIVTIQETVNGIFESLGGKTLLKKSKK